MYFRNVFPQTRCGQMHLELTLFLPGSLINTTCDQASMLHEHRSVLVCLISLSFVSTPLSHPGRRPSDEHDGPVQTHCEDRGTHGTLQRPGPQLHEGHSISQHQLRGVRIPQDHPGGPVQVRREAKRRNPEATGFFAFHLGLRNKQPKF